MRGRAAIAGVAIALARASLSGCSVIVEGVTGLVVNDGSVTAIVRTCPEITADEVHMTPTGGQFFLVPHPSWDFEAADDVTVELGSVQNFLTQVGDKQQALQSTVSGGVGGYLIFSAADIESLDDGMILASTQTSEPNVVVDSQGFEDLLAAVCK